MPSPSDQPPARDRFLALLGEAVAAGSLVKLTLGKARGADPTLRNIFVRPVALKAGPRLTFVWRHTARDVTKNLAPAEALAAIAALLGRDFLDAHLFTATHSAQLETQPDGSARLRLKSLSASSSVDPAPPAHDVARHHLIPADAPWLRALGVTNDRGQPRAEQAAKFRQIQKFAELVQHFVAETFPAPGAPLRVLDAGSGKGYLTFVVAALLGERAHVTGIEARPELAALCNRVARESHFQNLTFTPGQIADYAAPIQPPPPPIGDRQSAIGNSLDLLLALHACDTATDDALAHGITAGAALLIVAPCCQKEIRPQLTAPAVLADTLRHGIFLERQAEFVTDALRALLLEWAGYKTKVFEFVSTEHTAKNLLIVGQRATPPGHSTDAHAERLRAFARFYGIHHHRLAEHLGFPL